MTGQIAFGSLDFAENPEPRCPCILLLDTSGSMQGEAIAELNDGLNVFRDELTGDSLASKRVEVCIVSFGPVQVIADFQTAASFQPPQLQAQGDTPMGAAINQALDLVQQRKALYRANGIMFFRPWIFLITDGAPTDDWTSAAARIREAETSKAVAFFGVGVAKADMNPTPQTARFEVSRTIPMALELDEVRFTLDAWRRRAPRVAHRTGRLGDRLANADGVDILACVGDWKLSYNGRYALSG
jgi:uncharacterized protein YegL